MSRYMENWFDAQKQISAGLLPISQARTIMDYYACGARISPHLVEKAITTLTKIPTQNEYVEACLRKRQALEGKK